jgi:hypothetical protein
MKYSHNTNYQISDREKHPEKIIIELIKKNRLAFTLITILLIVIILGFLFFTQKNIYIFQQDNTLCINPLKGWVTDARDINISQSHSLVFSSFSWRDIESVKGKYNFEKFEGDCNFLYWKSKDIKIIIRLYLDYPKDKPHRDIPDWLFDEMNGKGVAYSNAYGMGFSPDYNNPLLLDYHEKLIKAIADRYDDDPNIAFVEIGSLGHWGEWHTGTNNDVQIPFASQEVCEAITNQYIKCFKNKILLMRRPTKIAAENKMGLFNDSFGDVYQTDDCFINWFNKGYVDLQTGVLNPPMQDFWMYSPSGGEVANYPGEQYFTSANIERTLRQLKVSHTSWLGPSGPFYSTNDEVIRNLDIVQNNMGYKFYISRVAFDKNEMIDGTKTLTISMNNIGNAPFYYNWPVKLYIEDFNSSIKYVKTADFDIRRLMPESCSDINLIIPKEFHNNAYKAYIGIVDPSTDQAAIHFSNKGNDAMMYLCDLG